MEGNEIRVTFVKREGAKWESKGDVVDCVWLGGGGYLGVGYGDFDLWRHIVMLSKLHWRNPHSAAGRI